MAQAGEIAGLSQEKALSSGSFPHFVNVEDTFDLPA
jgi:hypothetical protein